MTRWKLFGKSKEKKQGMEKEIDIPMIEDEEPTKQKEEVFLETSEVTELSMDNYPSYQVSIRWPGKERFIQFIEIEPVLYRIIHDPASPINKQILESLEFR